MDGIKLKWSFIVIDLETFFTNWTTSKFHYVKAIQFCANLKIGNVFSSDVLYTIQVSFVFLFLFLLSVRCEIAHKFACLKKQYFESLIDFATRNEFSS